MQRQGTKQFRVACANHFEDVADDTVHAVSTAAEYCRDRCGNDQAEELRVARDRAHESLKGMRSAQIVRFGFPDLYQFDDPFRGSFGRDFRQYAEWPGRDGHDWIGFIVFACSLECGIEQCRARRAIRELSHTRQCLAAIPRMPDSICRDCRGLRMIGRHLPNACASLYVFLGDFKFAHSVTYTSGLAIRPIPIQTAIPKSMRANWCWVRHAAMR